MQIDKIVRREVAVCVQAWRCDACGEESEAQFPKSGMLYFGNSTEAPMSGTAPWPAGWLAYGDARSVRDHHLCPACIRKFGVPFGANR